MSRAPFCALALCGCSLFAPIRDHTFDLADAGEQVDAGPQCTQACVDPEPICDVVNDRCLQCLTAADCNDGDPCTADRCNLDSTCTNALDMECVREVAVGDDHSCALFASGLLRCWGDNTNGQLGSTTDPPPSPTVVVAGIDAVDVDAGSNFTCAVQDLGTVECWGIGSDGQLGNGLNNPSASPVVVDGIDDALEVRAGTDHACARRAEGRVSCWGSDWYGQLGDGRSGDVMSNLPIEVAGLTGATQLAAEGYNTCALLGDGTARCWGRNDGGQVGDGTRETPRATPTMVADLTDAAQISGHCARRSGNSVVCWGSNMYGQVGDGSMADALLPATVRDLADAVDVDTSNWVGCAIRAVGETVCWGHNYNGQLGINESGLNTDRTTPIPVMNLPDARQVAVGSRHVCAVRTAGGVVCWGENSEGQVNGDTSTSMHAVPVPVNGLDPF